jgi:triosephosphate isomerase (TIM)
LRRRHANKQYMRPLIVGNWKMHGTAPQLAEIAGMAAAVRTAPAAADILICPPSTLITRAVQAATGQIAIGGQNCAAEISGAFTGDPSAEMLKDAGAAWIIVGHSERRQHHGETDGMVAAKARAVWRAGLLAIICIGETDTQRRSGNALTVCADQIAASVPDGITAYGNAIGYEPLWAIGTGHTPSVEEIGQMHSHIRERLVARWGAKGGEVRILYGGSVNATNARAVLAVPEVGGALVGGASLKATDFEAIVRAIPTHV